MFTTWCWSHRVFRTIRSIKQRFISNIPGSVNDRMVWQTCFLLAFIAFWKTSFIKHERILAPNLPRQTRLEYTQNLTSRRPASPIHSVSYISMCVRQGLIMWVWLLTRRAHGELHNARIHVSTIIICVRFGFTWRSLGTSSF